jgi:cytidine deaminase
VKKMNSEAIFNAAHSTAIRMLESGAYLTPNDTVCAIESASGRIYTGISRADMNTMIHAEIDAVRNMLAAGENIVQGLLLIGTQSRAPMLPCNNCLSYILSLAQENASCMIMMQDRMISIGEVGMYAAPTGGMNAPQNFGAPNGQQFMTGHGFTGGGMVSPLQAAPVPRSGATSVSVSVSRYDIDEMTASNAKSKLLKDKVSNLMKVAEDDDDDDEFLESLEKDTKKKRFGFFKK